MAAEIKVNYAEVESGISKIKSSLHNMPAEAGPSIAGNVLDSVDRLNLLNLKLEQVLASYQNLLNQNLDTTSRSVAFMQDSDQRVARGIQTK
ncbi:hypothetical protein FZC84_19335 [Rossellomorea vietnamensis]|uniref:YwqI/YxiC family protein n=1 Tax=Rossellomorea vietnamensis TaxID=218284 RepID=A0A5D4M7D1_9BACI|nr:MULTISPECIES: YwqI/YxiC family protein [Bacillaceae]TYR97387.1 hypothetical protein FZC84_19335 [Rossellomorea vietnamensis]